MNRSQLGTLAEMGNYRAVQTAYDKGQIDDATYKDLFSRARNQDASVLGTTGKDQYTGLSDAEKANMAGIPQAAPAAPVYTGPSQAQVDPLLEALRSLDTIRDNQRGEARSRYDRNITGYNEQDALDRQSYDKQVSQNEGNLSANRQAAMLQAAQGGQGLRAVLASLGALSGTGSLLADRAIAGAANKDIGQADDAFKTTADTLTSAWGNTEQEQRQRRLQAEAARDNEFSQAELARVQGRQSTLNTLANLYGANSSQGQGYLSQASSLYPQIAKNSAQKVADYAPRSSLYSPQAMETYKAGVQDLTVGARDGGDSTINSPLFALNPASRRREEELV